MKRSCLAVALLVTSLISVAGCGFGDVTTAEVLLIVSERDGDSEIFVMNADGSGVLQLTDNDFRDFDPAWSPDGNQILFVQANETGFLIHLVEADGSDENLLSVEDSKPYVNDGPVWSPDGEKIAFFSDRDGDSEIFVMNVDGSGVRQLTNNDVPDLYPLWSPDGEEIAFFGEFEKRRRMYKIHRSGSDLVMLGSYDLWFDWKDDPAEAS